MVKRSKQLESTLGDSSQKMNEMETEVTACQLRISQVSEEGAWGVGKTAAQPRTSSHPAFVPLRSCSA